MFHIELLVTPKKGVRDPQGEAVEEALRNSGYPDVEVGGVGRVLLLRVPAESAEAARRAALRMCEELLVNPCLETFELRMEQV